MSTTGWFSEKTIEHDDLSELERLFQRFLKHPKNPFWTETGKAFILLAPKNKEGCKEGSNEAIHYKYAQKIAEILTKEHSLNEEILEFVKENLRGTPAAHSAKRALKEIFKK